MSLRLLTLCCLLAALVACSPGWGGTHWPQATRTAPPPLPAYPGAQHVEEQATGPGKNAVYTRIFETTDPPDAVRAFYRDRLGQAGWKARREDFYENTQACPIYVALVIAKPAADGLTRVELGLGKEECMDR